MREITNECVGCATDGLPCMGNSCPNRNVVHYYCDRCGDEFDSNQLYQYEGEEVCGNCILEDFERIEV